MVADPLAALAGFFTAPNPDDDIILPLDLAACFEAAEVVEAPAMPLDEAA